MCYHKHSVQRSCYQTATKSLEPENSTLNHHIITVILLAQRLIQATAPRFIMASIQPPHPFRFLDLPPELRDQIYADLLTNEYDAELFRCPSIFQVSRLVHQEAKHILYQRVTFRFNVSSMYFYLQPFPFSKSPL